MGRISGWGKQAILIEHQSMAGTLFETTAEKKIPTDEPVMKKYWWKTEICRGVVFGFIMINYL